MTKQQVSLYTKYNDICMQDNTYKTNRYQYPLCFIAGIDGNFRTRLFAQALTDDETTDSFIFIFEHLLRASGGIEPVTLLTDACKAARNAVIKCFVSCIHLRCSWHLSQDVKKWLSSHGASNDAMKDFMSWFWRVRGTIGAESFEKEWSTFVEYWTDTLEETIPSVRDYLDFLTSDKQRWAFAYQSGIFTCGLSATSRIEGLFAQLNNRLSGASTLCDVYSVVEQICSRQNSYATATELRDSDNDYERWKETSMGVTYKHIMTVCRKYFTKYRNVCCMFMHTNTLLLYVYTKIYTHIIFTLPNYINVQIQTY